MTVLKRRVKTVAKELVETHKDEAEMAAFSIFQLDPQFLNEVFDHIRMYRKRREEGWREVKG
jgi:hypothetical protein